MMKFKKTKYYLAVDRNTSYGVGVVTRSCGPRGGSVELRWFAEIRKRITRKESERYDFFRIYCFANTAVNNPIVRGPEIFNGDHN